MKRRVFIKSGAITAGLVDSSSLLLTTAEECTREAFRHSSLSYGAAPEEIRSADYLHCVQADKYLPKLPPYLLEPDDTLKEWAWSTLKERYSQRHISHLYGAWPGDEVDLDRTPKLAKAGLFADRHCIPVQLAAHGSCHRALVGVRLKDSYMVDSELQQLIEEGYVGPTLRISHDSYAYPMSDAQGGIPAIMMEMLAYSHPGVVEVLPALPPSLAKGSINGMLLCTFTRLNKLAWDIDARTVDLTITTVKKQDITLIARYGIEKISALSGILATFRKGKADCNLHLPEKEPMEAHLELGWRKPTDWVDQVT